MFPILDFKLCPFCKKELYNKLNIVGSIGPTGKIIFGYVYIYDEKQYNRLQTSLIKHYKIYQDQLDVIFSLNPKFTINDFLFIKNSCYDFDCFFETVCSQNILGLINNVNKSFPQTHFSISKNLIIKSSSASFETSSIKFEEFHSNHGKPATISIDLINRKADLSNKNLNLSSDYFDNFDIKNIKTTMDKLLNMKALI